MGKGDLTRGAILGHALALASETGLEGVSIGALAERVGMSKSGLFAHFHSKESLQLAILERAIEHFVERVVSPSLKEPRGEPRVRSLVERWLDWAGADIMPGGCIFVSSIAELDDRPGIVRDRLEASQRDWLDTLATAIRIAIAEGHFRADLEPEQMAQELLTLSYGYHLVSRLLRDPAVEKRARATLERLFADAKARRH
ncbi:MAG: TetR/AcrR family transcriptional regulator [Sandaracinus sp.]